MIDIFYDLAIKFYPTSVPHGVCRVYSVFSDEEMWQITTTKHERNGLAIHYPLMAYKLH